MIRLTWNELYKIFHKKLLYIILIIAIGFSILACIGDKLLTNNSYDLDLTINNTMITNYENAGDVTSPEYISLKSVNKMIEIKKEKNIKKESPEEYYIDNVVETNYSNYFSATKSADILPENVELLKTTYEDSLKFLDSFDWKQLIKDEMNKIDTEEYSCSVEDQSKCDAIKKEEKKVLEYRLNNNIPYSYNDASSELVNYIEIYKEYLDVKDLDEKRLEYENKLNKRNVEEMYYKTKYLMDNRLLTNDYSLNNTGEDLAYRFGTPSGLLIIVLLALSASCIAEEFNKGTIKQLLVKPFSRTKIVLSKMFAVLITTIIMLFVLNISLVIINGLFNNDLKTVLGRIVIYDFNVNKCIEMSYIKYSLISFVYMLPQIILLSMFVFTMSVLSTNTAFALGMGFGAYVSETIFPLFLERFKFISYVPTLNYNLTTYMFGHINNYEGLTLSKAILVDSVSFVVLLVLIIFIFNKKDIKNQ